MEAAAALGVVSSVIAIAQLTAEITIATGKLIKTAGDAIPENEWIEEVAQRHQDLAADLGTSPRVTGPLSKIDMAVTKLAGRCLQESSALIASLQELKVPLRSDGTKSKLSAAKAVFKTMLRRGDLQARHNKLASLERQLAALLLHAIRTSQREEFADLRALVERNGRDCIMVIRGSQAALVDKIHTLQLGLQSIDQGVARVEMRQLDALDRQRVDDLLSSLAYKSMNSRKDMIIDPDITSYDWAFEDDEQPTKRWLNSSIAHCWISGEPGTGKSVFTKSLRLDRRSITALQMHANNDNLLVLDHYFWLPGESHQRSLRAMLQNLCFQALQQYPMLAEVAFPEEWTSRAPLRGMTWTTRTLTAALRKIITASGFKTCIFIDGLDECENKHRPELTRVLLQLSETASVKLCVSSRPWLEFEKAFSIWSRLKLPENSAWDVFELICSRLRSADGDILGDSNDDARLFGLVSSPDAQFSKEVRSLEPPQRLVYELYQKADGNLLWATTVLGAICERLADGQSPKELHRYVDSLPRDLEDYYFDLVYSRIHSTYREDQLSESAMALKIMQHAFESRGGYQLMWTLLESKDTGSGIVYDTYFAAHFPYTDDEPSSSQEAFQAVDLFVRSRCKDLIVTIQGSEFSSFDSCGLEYQHRVIYDFLRSPKMQSEIDSHVPGHFRAPQFELQIALVVAKLRFRKENGSLEWLFLGSAIERYIKCSRDPLDELTLKTCDEVATGILQSYAVISEASPRFYHSLISLPELARLMMRLAQCQRFGFVAEVISTGQQKASDHIQLAPIEDCEPLESSLWRSEQWTRRRAVPVEDESIREELVSSGRASCLYLICEPSFWTTFLEIIVRWGYLKGSSAPFWSESRAAAYIAIAFLEAGASMDVEICRGRDDCFGPRCVCSDPRIHSGLYECLDVDPLSGHKHEWVSAKNILVDHIGIPETDLDHILTQRSSHPTGAEPHNCQTASGISLYELAKETQDKWRCMVEGAVSFKERLAEVPYATWGA